MRTKLAIGLALLIGLPALAASPERKPWQWSVEERLAVRTNPQAAKARVSARGRVATTKAGRDQVTDSFNGQTHPELFLPHEVFDELMQLAFLSKPRTGDSFRKDMLPEVVRYGLPADFWDRLRNLSVIYMADVHRAYDPRRGGRNAPQGDRERAELDRDYAIVCRSRVETIAKARDEFGADRFNRFLYEVIAPNMFLTEFGPTDPSALRQAEEGCN